MDKIRLTRVMWSPRASSALCGFTEDGEYLTTDQVWYVADDLYEDLNGQLYHIVSRQPDGSNYQDAKKGE